MVESILIMGKPENLLVCHPNNRKGHDIEGELIDRRLLESHGYLCYLWESLGRGEGPVCNDRRGTVFGKALRAHPVVVLQ